MPNDKGVNNPVGLPELPQPVVPAPPVVPPSAPAFFPINLAGGAGVVTGVLPAANVDMSHNVITNPATSARNVIQPSLDTVASLTLSGHSPTQDAPLIDVTNNGTDIFVVAPAGGVSNNNIVEIRCDADTFPLFIHTFPDTTNNQLVVQKSSSAVGATQFAIAPDGSFQFAQATSAGGLAECARIIPTWNDNTAGTQKGRFLFTAQDSNGRREVVRGEADGSSARIGFLGDLAQTDQVSRSTAGLTASTTIANTTTETTLYTTTLAANRLTAGRTVRCRLYGLMSALVTDTVTLRFKLGGTTFLTIVSTAAAITGQEWSAEFVFTCRTTGIAGTVISQAIAIINSLIQDTTDSATHTVDTTAAQALTVTAQWSAASASDTITIQQATLEVLN